MINGRGNKKIQSSSTHIYIDILNFSLTFIEKRIQLKCHITLLLKLIQYGKIKKNTLKKGFKLSL